MATYFFGIDDGANEYSCSDGSTSTGKDVEIAINTVANVPSMEELQIAVENLQNYILRQGKVW